MSTTIQLLLLTLVNTAFYPNIAQAKPSAASGRVRSTTGYVDYKPSSGLNVILSAPHGGSSTPTSIPDRDAGCWISNQCVWSHDCGVKDSTRCGATTVQDTNTLQLTNELHQALCNRFNGRCPAAVISLLHRRKLDPNREVDEATFGVPLAVDVYDEYHGYIAAERAALGTRNGLYIDIHGHGHTIQKAELGYLLTASTLNSGQPINPNTTSIRTLAARFSGDFDQLLRAGPTSFGGLMETEGFGAVPSPVTLSPGVSPYFSGGYSTRVHGSVNGGSVDGIQIESPSSFRNTTIRPQYVAALVNVIDKYLQNHYN